MGDLGQAFSPRLSVLPRISSYTLTMLRELVVSCALLGLVASQPIEILSYSSPDTQTLGSHRHSMEGVPGEAVKGHFAFKAPDTEDTVYKVSYTADSLGFQPVGDHLFQPVEVPQQEVPVMVGYTPEVAAARDQFLEMQEKLMEQQMVEEQMMELEERRRRKREADPVVFPHISVSSSQFVPTYNSNSGLVPTYNSNPINYSPYYTYPMVLPMTNQGRVYPSLNSYPYPIYRIIPQVEDSQVPSMIQEGEEEPAALAL